VTRVLIVGTPRSGTTWVGQTLGRAEGARYVHEPDGDYEPFALRAKLGRPRHLELAPGDDDPRFGALWEGAFAGGVRAHSLRARVAERLFERTARARRLEARRTGRLNARLRAAVALARPLGADPSAEHVVVKSVHASLCTEWIVEQFRPRVVVVDRNPLNALASWHELNQGVDPVEYEQLRVVARRRWTLELPGADAPRIARQAAFLGVLRGALNEAALAHSDWVRVRHDDLLSDTQERFGELCRRAGLEFSTASAAYLEDSNTPGDGYATTRVAGALAQRWRATLTPEHVDTVLETLRSFPERLRLLDAVEEEAS
jgi:hypothetical protein